MRNGFEWYIVNYDLNKYHTVVKTHCLANGFVENVQMHGRPMRMPNTTLAISALSAEVAAMHFKAVATRAAPWDLKIEKVLVCPLGQYYAEAA